MADEAPYVNVPAASVARVCTMCGGTGEVAMPLTPAVEGALVGYEKCRPCTACRSRTGRVSVGTGPGARLSRMERARGPWDDWIPRPS